MIVCAGSGRRIKGGAGGEEAEAPRDVHVAALEPAKPLQHGKVWKPAEETSVKYDAQ